MKSKKCSLFSTLGEPSENNKELQDLTLVGPPRDNLELDSLPVLHLDNRLYILKHKRWHNDVPAANN